jgi:hypothetical protein
MRIFAVEIAEIAVQGAADAIGYFCTHAASASS